MLETEEPSVASAMKRVGANTSTILHSPPAPRPLGQETGNILPVACHHHRGFRKGKDPPPPREEGRAAIPW